tara:strand:- start:108 stop:332 length:225 start_codon:yes stop_codon:yes gene_type:complete
MKRILNEKPFQKVSADTLKKRVDQNTAIIVSGSLTDEAKQNLMFETESMLAVLFDKGWNNVTDWETMKHCWVKR